MDIENARKIVEELQWEGIDHDAKVYDDYSGRGMYGEQTAAVVTHDPDQAKRLMGKLGIEDYMRTDNLGLQYVVY